MLLDIGKVFKIGIFWARQMRQQFSLQIFELVNFKMAMKLRFRPLSLRLLWFTCLSIKIRVVVEITLTIHFNLIQYVLDVTAE